MDVACQIYIRGKDKTIETPVLIHEEDIRDNTNDVAQTVGHNMYILAYQVMRKRKKFNFSVSHRFSLVISS